MQNKKIMNDLINIKCPYCSVILKVKNQPGLQNMSITCPVCKRKSLVRDFKVVKNKQDDEQTLVSQNKKSVTNEDATIVSEARIEPIGSLVLPNGKPIQLHIGVNAIGRESRSTLAEIKLPDKNKTRKISRNHAKIEVIRMANGSCKHILFNWENKNPTFVNGDVVEKDDRIVLHDNDRIRFVDVDVVFRIYDDEETNT